MADISAVREITDRLETGVKELFESEKYAAYLQTMSRFHNYSTRNTLLIHISSKTGYRLLHSGKIKHFSIGRSVRIPKIRVIDYIIGDENNKLSCS